MTLLSPDAYAANPRYLQPNETPDQYNARIGSQQTRTPTIGAGAPATTLMPGPQSPGTGLTAAVQALLTKSQQMGTKNATEQGLNAQGEQFARLGAKTPDNLIGASPDVQNGVRSDAVSALTPTITGANNDQQTLSEQIKGFGDILKTYQDNQDKVRQDTQNQIKFVLDSGGADALQTLYDNNPDVFKVAGYDDKTAAAFIQGAKHMEASKVKHAASSGGTLGTQSSNNSTLASVGLPLTLVSKKGVPTQSALSKVTQAGIPLDIASGIFQNITAGNDLETIRQGLASQYGHEQGYQYLDAFMSALQG